MNNYMKLIGIKAKKSCENRLNTKKKNLVLNDYAKLLDKEKKFIIRENLKDIKSAKKKIKRKLNKSTSAKWRKA